MGFWGLNAHQNVHPMGEKTVEGFAIQMDPADLLYEKEITLTGSKVRYVATDLSGNNYMCYLNADNSNENIQGSLVTIEKRSKSDTVIWTKQFSGKSTLSGYPIYPGLQIHSMVVDSSQNIYFGGQSMYNDISGALTGIPGTKSLFFIKLDSNGGYLWGKWLYTHNGQNDDLRLAVDWSNDVYVTGTNHGRQMSGYTSIAEGNNYSVFIGKYNSSGKLQFGKFISASGNIQTIVIKSNIFLFGSASSLEGNSTVISNNWGPFVAQYNSSTGDHINSKFLSNSGQQCAGDVFGNSIYATTISPTRTVLYKLSFDYVEEWNQDLPTNDRLLTSVVVDTTGVYILLSQKNPQTTILIKISPTNKRIFTKNLGSININSWDLNLIQNSVTSNFYAACINKILKYTPDFFQVVKDFYNIYITTIPYTNTATFAANTNTVISYINSNLTATTAWTNLEDKSTILTTGEDAYIDIANVLIANYRTAFATASTYPGFTLTGDALAAGTVTPTNPTYVEAQTNITNYVRYFGLLENAVKAAITRIQGTYTTARAALPAGTTIPTNLDLSGAVYTPLIDATEAPFLKYGSLSNLVPILTSFSTTLTDGTYTVSSSNDMNLTNSNFHAFDPADNVWGSSESATSATPQWLQIQLPSAKPIIRYTVKNASNFNVAPRVFQIRGSNDGTTWTTLDTVMTTSASNPTVFTKTLSNLTSSYSYYRLHVTSTITSGNRVVVAYFQLQTANSDQLASTKQEQLHSIWSQYNAAADGMQVLAYTAQFKTAYEAARFYIVDTDLLATTVTTKNRIHANSTVTMANLLVAFRDVMAKAVARYVAVQSGEMVNVNAAEAATPVAYPVVTIPTEDNPSTMDLDGLTTLSTKYFGTNGLWLTLRDRMSSTVRSAITGFQTAAGSAGVTAVVATINRDLSGAEAANADVFPIGIFKYGGQTNTSNVWNNTATGGNALTLIGADRNRILYFYRSDTTTTYIFTWNGSTMTQLGSMSGVYTISQCTNDNVGNVYFLCSQSNTPTVQMWTVTTKTFSGLNTSFYDSLSSISWVSNLLFCITSDISGNIYISGQSIHGTARYNSNESYSEITLGGIIKYTGSTRTNVSTQKFNIMASDNTGKLYGAPANSGSNNSVFQSTDGGATWTTIGQFTGGSDYGTAYGRIASLYCDSKNTLFVGGNFGMIGSVFATSLAKWNETWSAHRTTQRSLGSGLIQNIAEDSKGNIWFSYYIDAFYESSFYITNSTTNTVIGGLTTVDIGKMAIDLTNDIYIKDKNYPPRQYLGIVPTFLNALYTLNLKYILQAFRIAYQTARRFITDSELSTITINTRLAIYTNATVTYTAFLAARRDVLRTVINKYWLLNPAGTLAPAPAPSIFPALTLSPSTVPTTDTVTDATTAATLDSLESNYLTGTSALWPALLTRIRTSVQSYIDTYKTIRVASGATTGAEVIDDTVCDADKANLAATNFTRSTDLSGVITTRVTTPAGTTLSEYTFLTDVYSKYFNAVASLLGTVREEAKTFLGTFTTYYTTTLANCLPIASAQSTALQTAVANYTTDGTAIDNGTTFAAINALRDRYRQGIADLFNAEVADARANVARYISLLGKYNTFRTSSAITAFGVTLVATTLPNGTQAQTDLSGLTTATLTAQLTTGQVTTLAAFCNSYNGTNGNYTQLVAFIRGELQKFIQQYDQVWNNLAADVRNRHSYTSPLTNNQLPITTTDAILFDLMNQYAGLPRDTLAAPGPAAAPTVALAATFTTARNEMDALARALDFGTLYVRLVPFLQMTADTDPQRVAVETLADQLLGWLGNAEKKIPMDIPNILSAVNSLNVPTFTTNMASLLDLARTNINRMVIEYAALYRAYRNFRYTFSERGGLPAMTEFPSTLSLLAPRTKIVMTRTATSNSQTSVLETLSEMFYIAPPPGTYNQINRGDIQLYGNALEYPTFLNYVTEYTSKLQSMVAHAQSEANEFFVAIAARITGLPTIPTDSVPTDSNAATLSKSAAIRATMNTTTNDITVWFMQTFLLDYLKGVRYLSATDVSTVLREYLAKCRIYLKDSGDLKTSPLTMVGFDLHFLLVDGAGTALQELAQKLASRYKTTFATWITGKRVGSLTAILPATIDTDIQTGSEEVRKRYLAAWPTLMADVRNATSQIITGARDLAAWRRTGTIVAGTTTTGLNML